MFRWLNSPKEQMKFAYILGYALIWILARSNGFVPPPGLFGRLGSYLGFALVAAVFPGLPAWIIIRFRAHQQGKDGEFSRKTK